MRGVRDDFFSFRILAASCVAATLLAGCGNDPHPPPLHEKHPDGTPWRVGYRVFPDDPKTLDPQVSYDTTGHALIANVYECPLQYHPFKTDPYELIPCLLEEMPRRTREEDGRETYLFTLKKGLTFHDDPCFTATGGKGREVTAEDMAYIFKRIADPKVECPIFATLQDYVEGLGAAFAEAKAKLRFDYDKPLPGLEVVDRYTFRLHLTKAYPQILYWFAMPFTAPVPREAVEYYDGRLHDGVFRDQFKFHPVGTGAFVLRDWRRRSLIRLTRFERYRATRFPDGGWGAEDDARFRPLAGKPLPFLDEIQLMIIRESVPAWLLFRQGYLDSSGVSKDAFDSVISPAQGLTPEFARRGVRLYKEVEPCTYFLVFNMNDPVVGKNRKLRQAICCAYDEDRAIQIFQNGMGVNAQQLLPPGVYGHEPGFRNPLKQHDMDLARKLLKEAGFPDGVDPKTGQPLELTLDVTVEGPESRQHAQFEKAQLESLGLRVKIEENMWSRQQEKFDSGNFQIIGYGWMADYPDPENFLFLFYGRNAAPQGNNYSRYSNPEFDRLFERMRAMDDSPQRLDVIRQLGSILNEDCPWVLESHPVNFALTQSWYPRVSSNPLLAGSSKYADVDIESRKAFQQAWNRPVMWPLALVVVLAAAVLMWTWNARRRPHV